MTVDRHLLLLLPGISLCGWHKLRLVVGFMVIRVLLLKFDQLFNRVYHWPFLHSCRSDYLLRW